MVIKFWHGYKMGKETLHRLMFGLLYPAVLGSIFVSFISVDIQEPSHHPRLVFGLVFIYHWALQFAFSTSPGRSKNYSKSKFSGDVCLIIGMNIVFYSLPSHSEYLSGANYTWYYFGLFLIGGGFVFRELFDVWLKDYPFRLLNTLNSGYLMMIGFSLFVICLLYSNIASNSIICFIVIYSTLLSSIFDTIFSKSSEDKKLIGG